MSEVTKSVNSAPGSLQQLSLAVAVNSSVKGVNVAEIKQLVSAAVGLQPSRGDSIQVAFVPFDQSAAKLGGIELKAGGERQEQGGHDERGAGRAGAARGARPARLLHAQDHQDDPRAPGLAPGFQALELESGEGYADDEEMALALTAPRTSQMAEPLGPAQAEVSQIGQMIERRAGADRRDATGLARGRAGRQ